MVENSDEDIQVTFYLTDAHEMNWVTEFLDSQFFNRNETEKLFQLMNARSDARGQNVGGSGSQWAQCGHGEGIEAIGGWRFGNTINGAQAEYLLVPNAQANLAKIPDELTDEQVVFSRTSRRLDSAARNRRRFASAIRLRFLRRDPLACAPPREPS